MVEYEIEAKAVCPVLLTVQLMLAALGSVLGVPPEHASANDGGLGLTVRLIADDAAEPVFGVAVNVPLYVAGAVPEVTVTVPQVAPAAQEPVGPTTLAPAMDE